ncbi:MAG: hypothetical protein IPO26_18385 [Saprospiraceae bacterium]|nr:hypothetical protein [Saprospiraceae bacterium]
MAVFPTHIVSYHSIIVRCEADARLFQKAHLWMAAEDDELTKIVHSTGLR